MLVDSFDVDDRSDSRPGTLQKMSALTVLTGRREALPADISEPFILRLQSGGRKPTDNLIIQLHFKMSPTKIIRPYFWKIMCFKYTYITEIERKKTILGDWLKTFCVCEKHLYIFELFVCKLK